MNLTPTPIAMFHEPSETFCVILAIPADTLLPNLSEHFGAVSDNKALCSSEIFSSGTPLSFNILRNDSKSFDTTLYKVIGELIAVPARVEYITQK